MKNIFIATKDNIEDIVSLRVEMQIEDWNTTLNKGLVSVYTKPEYRGKGYQQEVLKHLLDYAKKENFNDITLTTNTPDAAHIYEKAGFKLISNKYFLSF